jgi:hypothetical protein
MRTNFPILFAWMLVAFAVSGLASLHDGSFLALLTQWLPMIASLILLNLVTPVNRLKSLNGAFKGLIILFGALMIAWGIYRLVGMPSFRSILDLHSVPVYG